jgi:ribosomal-protein-alanine N-acetyltransferase
LDEPAVCIRPLEGGDLDVVVEIESLIQTEPWSRASFAGELSYDPPRFFVIEVRSPRNAVVGYGGCSQTLDESTVMNFGVHPDFQRKGFGKILLSFLITQVRGRGSSALVLEVRADRPAAVRFYESLGFEKAGHRPRMYAGGADGFVMTRSLR